MKIILLLLCSLVFVKADELEVTFASYNIRYENGEDTEWRAWSDRLQRLVKTVRKMNPDVLGIQEALHGQVADLRISLPDYDFYGVGRDDGKTMGEYSGIFFRKSRFSQNSKDTGIFWLSDTPSTPGSMTWGNKIPRVCVWLYLVDRATNRGITVYNTHWDHQYQGSREKAAKMIASQIDQREKKNEPIVLLGDFNAAEGNHAVDFLAGRNQEWGNSLVDTFDESHKSQRERRTLHFWKNHHTGWLKVDHILVSKPVCIKSAEIIYPENNELPASDHFPVMTKIVWK
jgi:endonuclease/exonuclease/phosphatase family metal-dependent hydrolase